MGLNPVKWCQKEHCNCFWSTSRTSSCWHGERYGS